MKIEFTGLMDWLNRPQTLTRVMKASRFLAILLGILAAASLLLLIVLLWPVLTSGRGIPLLALLDEMDDEIEAIFLMAFGAAVCAFVSRLLRRRGQPKDALAVSQPVE